MSMEARRAEAEALAARLSDPSAARALRRELVGLVARSLPRRRLARMLIDDPAPGLRLVASRAGQAAGRALRVEGPPPGGR